MTLSCSYKCVASSCAHCNKKQMILSCAYLKNSLYTYLLHGGGSSCGHAVVVLVPMVASARTPFYLDELGDYLEQIGTFFSRYLCQTHL